MWLYALIMVIVACVFGVVTVMIYRGRTDLIHAYHQEKVKDYKAYGKAFARALSIMPISMLVSAVVSLISEDETIVFASLLILFTGLVVGLIKIYVVQKIHNQGIF